MENAVTFGVNDRLFGILSEPDCKSLAGIMLAHGWSGYRCGPHRMFVSLSRALCDAGVASLRFDLSGRGGVYEDVNLDNMIDDTIAAVSLLRKNVAKVFACSHHST